MEWAIRAPSGAKTIVNGVMAAKASKLMNPIEKGGRLSAPRPVSAYPGFRCEREPGFNPCANLLQRVICIGIC